jgi:outer membrane beta-barrel protein
MGLLAGVSARAAPAPATGQPPANPFDDKATMEPGATSGEPGRATPESESPAAEDDTDADQQDVEPGEAGGDGALHALTCLEGDSEGGGRRKGVQRRDFLKRHRFEISGIGGFYASDTLSSTYSYGGALSFYPSEDFGLEALVTRSPVKFRLEEPFSGFDRSQRFLPGNAWQGILSLIWSPIHAKLRFSDANIVHTDIFVAAGAGKTIHDSVQGLTWEAGVGMKLYLSRFVTVRIDIRDFLLPQEVLGRGRITNNVTVLAGVSLWLPG